MLQSRVLLDVKELRYSYGERVAVNGASFQIHRGEIFGFLGPNGAGKTTTISCLSGLLGDWKGELLFDGNTFSPSKNIDDRKRLGTVPQELALYEDLTAKENLTFFGRLNALRGSELEQAVQHALQIAELTDRENSRVKEFSGGMKRRLNLAAGTLHKPDLLLLDEPTAGVDPQSRNHIFEALLNLKKNGQTLLYTTHYMEEAEKLCDRIAIINEGEVCGVGTPHELASRAGNADANLEEIFLQLTGRKLRDQ